MSDLYRPLSQVSRGQSMHKKLSVIIGYITDAVLTMS